MLKWDLLGGLGAAGQLARGAVKAGPQQGAALQGEADKLLDVLNPDSTSE